MNHKHEIITEDEETDINVDDDDPYDKTLTSKASSMSFSISNILSDSFGPKPVKLEENPNAKTIFRPFELKNFISNSNDRNIKPFVQNPSSIFLSNFRLSELFDYSTKHSAPRGDSDNNNLRNSLYNSLSAYPKIHEEILNSHKKNSNVQTTSNYNLATSSSRIPPLGGLCKTISQIGQENVTQSSQSPNKLSKGHLDSIKIQQSPAESVDSDDCTSEASTSKDESQKMWPAWVSEESMLVYDFKLTYYVFSSSSLTDFLHSIFRSPKLW